MPLCNKDGRGSACLLDRHVNAPVPDQDEKREQESTENTIIHIDETHSPVIVVMDRSRAIEILSNTVIFVSVWHIITVIV